MSTPVFGTLLLSLVFVVTVPVTVSMYAPDCPGGMEKLEFVLFLDEDSLTENGWSLECNDDIVGEDNTNDDFVGGTIWNVPVGSLQGSSTSMIHSEVHNAKIPSIMNRVCLPEQATCHFTIEDKYGDGLLSPGYFYLTFGSKMIATSEMEEEFLEKSYCFGPNCGDQVPEEQQLQDDGLDTDCDQIYIEVHTDANPRQNTISLQCNGESIFRQEFSQEQPSAVIDRCVSTILTSTCCTLSITDSAGDGLDVLEGGRIYAEWATSVIINYNDASNAFKFDVAEFDFGMDCPVPATESPNAEPEIATAEPEPSEEETTTTSTDIPRDADEATSTNKQMSKKERRSPAFFSGIGSLVMVVIIVLCWLLFRAILRRQPMKDDQSEAAADKDSDGSETSSYGTDLVEVRSQDSEMYP